MNYPTIFFCQWHWFLLQIPILDKYLSEELLITIIYICFNGQKKYMIYWTGPYKLTIDSGGTESSNIQKLTVSKIKWKWSKSEKWWI